MLCRILSLVSTFALGVLTARALGAGGRGIFATPTVDAGIATSPFAGLAMAESFFLLNRRAGRGAPLVMLLVSVPFVITGIIAVVLLGWIGHHSWATVYAMAAVPLAATTAITTGLCDGTKRVRLSSYIALAYATITLFATALAFQIFGRSPYVAINAWLFGYLCIAAFGLYLIVRFGARLRGERVAFQDALAFAIKAGAANFVSLLNYRADVYVVALFGTPAMLGVYTLAVTGAEAALAVTLSIAAASAPHIASLPPEQSQALTAKATRNNFAVASAACVLIAMVTPILIKVGFGPSFTQLAPTLDILLIGMIALSANSVFSNYFTLALGKPSINLYVSGASAALCITISALLVPRIGIAGAALATACSYVAAAVVQVILFRRTSGLPLRLILLVTTNDIRSYRALAKRLLSRVWRRNASDLS